ncbi:hypothetical protein [Streptomyces sp. RK9]|uniref:hypothetical protein n=1 Tax=Streptomyces sp. RK9 TaxID=3239284 RepID=UPI0038706379
MQVSSRAGREGDVLAVVCQSGPSVSFFDAASDRCLGSVETLAQSHELCFDPQRRLLWCTMTYRSGFYYANTGRRTELTVIDPDTRRVVEVVEIVDLETLRPLTRLRHRAFGDAGAHGLAYIPRRA